MLFLTPNHQIQSSKDALNSRLFVWFAKNSDCNTCITVVICYVDVILITRKSAVQGTTSIASRGIGTLLSVLEVNRTICRRFTGEKWFRRFGILDLNFHHQPSTCS